MGGSTTDGLTCNDDVVALPPLAVIENAGHAFMHERPELLGALIGDWLERAHPGSV